MISNKNYIIIEPDSKKSGFGDLSAVDPDDPHLFVDKGTVMCDCAGYYYNRDKLDYFRQQPQSHYVVRMLKMLRERTLNVKPNFKKLKKGDRVQFIWTLNYQLDRESRDYIIAKPDDLVAIDNQGVFEPVNGYVFIKLISRDYDGIDIGAQQHYIGVGIVMASSSFEMVEGDYRDFDIKVDTVVYYDIRHAIRMTSMFADKEQLYAVKKNYIYGIEVV